MDDGSSVSADRAAAQWRVAAARWLRRSGVPAFVPGYARPRAVLRRWPWVLLIAAAVAGVALLAVVVAGYAAQLAAPWLQVVLILGSLAAGAAATAVGLPEIGLFALTWFARTAWRSGGGMLRVLPILLVALVFTFLSAETWQSIGRLTGTPLVLATALVVVLAMLPLLRSAADDHAEPLDVAAVSAALPVELAGDAAGDADGLGTAVRLGEVSEPGGVGGSGLAGAGIAGGGPAGAPWSWFGATDLRTAPPLGATERLNLRLIGTLGRALVAVVVALAVAAFFCVFGVLTVDEAVTATWSGAAPDVWWQFTAGTHRYTLTAEHVRVAMFLGVFSALYFVASASTDRHLADALSADTRAHVRQCLAVRAIYRASAGAPPRPPEPVDVANRPHRPVGGR